MNHRRLRSASVLLSWRRGAFLEGPHAMFELEHQQPVVLASGPEGPLPAVTIRDMQVNLRRAPVRATRDEVVRDHVVRSGADRRLPGRVVVGNLLRTVWVADVEHADA